MGLSASREYLLVLNLNVLYTPHAWTLPWFGSFLYLDDNSLLFMGPTYVAHQCDQTIDARCQHLMPISDADVWGLASTQAPQSRAVTCFSVEAKWLPMTTYVANEWQDEHSALRWRLTILFHQRTCGNINSRGSRCRLRFSYTLNP